MIPKRLAIFLLMAMFMGISFFLGIHSQPKATIYNNKYLRNMANTVSPIITMLAETLGEYENIQLSIGPNPPAAMGGKLIYKREVVAPINGMSCIRDKGNVYYIRLHEWGYDPDLWYKPIKDIPVGAYSCIDEEDVFIPYWDKELQNTEMGKKYYVGKGK